MPVGGNEVVDRIAQPAKSGKRDETEDMEWQRQRPEDCCKGSGLRCLLAGRVIEHHERRIKLRLRNLMPERRPVAIADEANHSHPVCSGDEPFASLADTARVVIVDGYWR